MIAKRKPKRTNEPLDRIAPLVMRGARRYDGGTGLEQGVSHEKQGQGGDLGAFLMSDMGSASKVPEKAASGADFDRRLTVLDLFSGIGGFSYGLEMTGHYKTVGFCEIADFPRKVLRKHWGNDIPIFEDIHDVTADSIQQRGISRVDVITAGFPCQPFSGAGRRSGTKDKRFLWPELFRVIADVKPRYVILENVDDLLSIQSGLVFGGILYDLRQAGYDVEWRTLSASQFGAPHRRERIFLLISLTMAYTNHSGQDRKQRHSAKSDNRPAGKNQQARQHLRGKISGYGELGHANSQRLQGHRAGSLHRENAQIRRENRFGLALHTGTTEGHQENNATQSRLGRGAHGIPDWLDSHRWVAPRNEPQYDWEPPRLTDIRQADRIKALGNAVVPQVVAFVGECLWRYHEQQRPQPGEQPSAGDGQHEERVDAQRNRQGV